ncbi:MAG: hypothetical protein QOD62_796 [Actinomycetota bacterium]|nr:hypothetical protein [Actinomycetota bacterium]
MGHGGSYEEVVERARAAAAAKRLSGEVPEGTGAALDRLFLEVAPGGARPEGEGLEAVVDMLGRYRYDPSIALASAPGLRGMVAGLAKRALRPVTVWTLRHLTDQLNAYHLAETELLRAIVQTREAESGDSGVPG